MSTSLKSPRKESPADLQDFVLAVSTALQGAAARFPKDDRPPIIFGAWTGPVLTNPTLPGLPGSDRGATSAAPVAQISGELRGVGGELSEEGIARMNKHLSERGDGSEVAIALFADPVKAMADLFDMDEEQVANTRQDACSSTDLPFMLVAAQAIQASGIPMSLDLKITDGARKQKGKKKWCVQSFTIGGSGTVSGGASGTSGGGTVSGSVTFGRCK